MSSFCQSIDTEIFVTSIKTKPMSIEGLIPAVIPPLELHPTTASRAFCSAYLYHTRPQTQQSHDRTKRPVPHLLHETGRNDRAVSGEMIAQELHRHVSVRIHRVKESLDDQQLQSVCNYEFELQGSPSPHIYVTSYYEVLVISITSKNYLGQTSWD